MKEIITNKLYPTSRSNANLEAEKGETVITNLNGDGIPEFYEIKGKPHSKGGTPLNLPENSFIYSKFNKMKIKDPQVLSDLGMKYKRSGYTPAEISKRFDFSDDTDVLNNPYSSDLDRRTAEYNIKNKINKLGETALAQESLKGFKDGIPMIAMPYLQNNGIDPTSLIMSEEDQQALAQQQQMDMQQPQQYQEEIPMAQYGGYPIFEVPNDYFIEQYDSIPVYKGGGEGGNGEQEVKNHGISDDDIALFGNYWSDKDGYNTLLTFFEENPEELESLINTWKTMDFKVDDNYAKGWKLSDNYKEKIGNPEKFIKAYTKWIKMKLEYLQSDEYKNSNPQGSTESPNNKQNRNSNSGKQRFVDFMVKKGYAVSDKNANSLIKMFQSMDQAFQKYANDSKKVYTKNVTGSDPNNKADAMNTTYGDKSSMGVSTIDGYPGDKTLDFLPYAVVPNDDVDDTDNTKTASKTKYNHIDNESKSPFNSDWYLQDKVNYAGAIQDYLDAEKYLPWDAPINYEDINPTFYDYRNNASQAASNAASIMNASGLSADPQQQVVMADALMNGLNEQVMNLQSNENNYNVNTANTFEEKNASLRNSYNDKVAARANDLYDKTVKVNQAFTNDRRALRKNIRDTFNNAVTNAAKTQILNTMHDNYMIDPRTGGTMAFYYDDNDVLSAHAKASKIAEVNSIAAELVENGYDKKDALNAAVKIATGQGINDVDQLAESIYSQLGLQNQGN